MSSSSTLDTKSSRGSERLVKTCAYRLSIQTHLICDRVPPSKSLRERCLMLKTISPELDDPLSFQSLASSKVERTKASTLLSTSEHCTTTHPRMLFCSFLLFLNSTHLSICCFYLLSISPIYSSSRITLFLIIKTIYCFIKFTEEVVVLAFRMKR